MEVDQEELANHEEMLLEFTTTLILNLEIVTLTFNQRLSFQVNLSLEFSYA